MLTESGTTTVPDCELTIHHDPCIVGTLYYLAPEVLNRKYSSKVDVWAIGVIAFTILCGILPFMSNAHAGNAAGKQQILNRIRAGDFRVSDVVSDQGKDFLKRLMCIYPNSRVSAREALEHVWLEEVVQEFKIPIFPSEVVADLRWFSKLPVLQRAVYILSACLAPSFESIDFYSRVFISWDKNLDGRISRTEFHEIMAFHQEEVITEIEADLIFDSFGSEFLSFNDFLAACAIKHIIHHFPFIPALVFSRLAARSDSITTASLEHALGCCDLIGVPINTVSHLPLDYDPFLKLFFGPELLLDTLLVSLSSHVSLSPS
jgi:calcium-dependent protein kinase